MPAARPTARPHVIGLVVTLAPRTPATSPWLVEFRARPGVRVGGQQDCWIPITAEVDDPWELHRWLETRPGVQAVDVAFVEVVGEAFHDSDFVPQNTSDP